MVNFILLEDYNGLEIGGSYNVPIRSGDGKFGKAKYIFGKCNRWRQSSRNLFDRNPPLTIGNGASFQTGYDPTYFDACARTAYITAHDKFF